MSKRKQISFYSRTWCCRFARQGRFTPSIKMFVGCFCLSAERFNYFVVLSENRWIYVANWLFYHRNAKIRKIGSGLAERTWLKVEGKPCTGGDMIRVIFYATELVKADTWYRKRDIVCESFQLQVITLLTDKPACLSFTCAESLIRMWSSLAYIFLRKMVDSPAFLNF